MNFKESILIALGALRANKLRSLLTLLGIVLGVMTVISTTTIIEGINASFRKEMEIIGSNTFYVRKFPAIVTGHEQEKYRNRKEVTIEQAEAIRERATLVSYVEPESFTGGHRVRYGGERTNPDVTIMGSGVGFQVLNGRFIDEGRFIREMDIRANRKVCVIGLDIVEKLFPFEDPIDKDIRVGPEKFRVIGVLEEKGNTFGQSQDNMVIMPYTTFRNVFGKDQFIQIAIQAKDPEQLAQTIDEVVGIMRVERKVRPGQDNDFEILTRDSIMDTYNQITGVIFAAAVGIAMISLLVGGIGIMNIMLVSVTERTREIGIRKSMGAKKRDILWQFVVEAVVLAAFGGLVGIAVGLGIGELIGAVTPLPAAVPVWAVITGLVFSSAVGMFFGIFPAAKAAKLDPIVALRAE
ncbi:ABC transporter permease [bacterium]|nr:ABC transporter permease [bacterium]